MRVLPLIRLIAIMLPVVAGVSFGQNQDSVRVSVSEDAIRMQQEACNVTIAADQARDAGKFDEAVELFSAGMDSYRQLAKRYPSYQSSLVENQLVHCVNELRILLQRNDMQKRYGERLNSRLKEPIPHYVSGGPREPDPASGPMPMTSGPKPVAQQRNETERKRLLADLYSVTRSTDTAVPAGQPAAKVTTGKIVPPPLATSKETPPPKEESISGPTERSELEELNRKCETLTKQRKALEQKLEEMGDARQTAESERQTREATEKLLEQIDDENRKLQKDKRGLEKDVARLEKSLSKKTSKKSSAADAREEESAEDLSVVDEAVTAGVKREKSDVVVVDTTKKETAVSGKAAGVPETEGEKVTRNILREVTAFMREGNLANAEELLVVGLEKAPGDREIVLLLGTVYCREREYEKAVSVIRPVVESDPTDAKARVVLGGAYLALGKYGDARMELEGAVGFEPDLVEAHYNFAQVLLLTKPADPARAKEEYQMSLKLGGQPDRAFEAALEKALGARPAAGKPVAGKAAAGKPAAGTPVKGR